MRNKKLMLRISVYSVLLLLAVPIMTACPAPVPDPDVVEPIVLGVPLSIGFADGWTCEMGIRLAVEEINAKGGVNVGGVMRPFKLEVIDTRCLEPGVPVMEALLAVEKLILEEGADFLVGGPIRSEAALAAMDVKAKHKTVSIIAAGVLSPAYHARIAEDLDRYRYLFRTTGCIRPLIGEIVDTLELVRAEHGFDRVFIMVQDVAHARASGDAVTKGLEGKGWDILGSEIYPTGTTDFSIGLLKAKEAGAQILFLWFDMPEAAILLSQWYDLKVPALPIGYLTAAKEEGFWEATDGKAEYVVTICAKAGAVPTEAIPETLRFVEAYRQRWGVAPAQEWASVGYMAVHILKDAIERAGSLEDDAVITALRETDMMGTYGRIRFDPKSHQIIHSTDPAEGAVSLWTQWIDGKRVAVFPPKIATQPVEIPHWIE